MEHLKNPLALSMNQFVSGKSADALQGQGQIYPCTVTKVTGAIVTVNFEVQTVQTIPQATMPVAESIYLRLPIQVGDKGVAMTADTYLGGISGLGGGTADTTQLANLSTLIFVPIGNSGWPSVDANAVVITGVGTDGVLLRSGDATVTFKLTSSGIAINLNGMTMTVTNGDVIADGISLKTHVHTEVMTGGGNSGPPLA